MLDTLYFVTSNPNKFAETRAIIDYPIERIDIDVPEIQSLHLEEVVRAKAEAAYGFAKAPVIVEDVSLEIAALCGLPGPFVKWFNQTLTPEGIVSLLKMHNDRRVTARELVDLYDGTTHRLFEGVVEGMLADNARGESGFGFDTIFVPSGYDQTYAELSSEEKNRISHRAQAMGKLAAYLKKHSD